MPLPTVRAMLRRIRQPVGLSGPSGGGHQLPPHRRSLLRHMSEYVQRNLKNRSHTILRLWTDHCEYIAAQRCRRAQQMACLYGRLWEERALRELMRRLRKQVQRHTKSLMLGAAVLHQTTGTVDASAAAAAATGRFDWDSERIAYDSIRPHLDEIDFVRQLQLATIVCARCQRRTVIDARIDGIDYCSCSRDERLEAAAAKAGQSAKDTATKKCDNSKATAATATAADAQRFAEWKPYLERENMVIWRREERPGLYAYKVHASYTDVSAEDFLYVQTDTEYRKVWDKTAIALDIVDVDPANSARSQVVYWEMLWPKFFANRDYVYRRRVIVDRQRRTIVIANQSIRHPCCPPQPSKQRVADYWSYMVIRPTAGGFRRPGLEYVLTYFDNPGVVVPPAITSWVAQKQMPDFLSKLHQATVEFARTQQAGRLAEAAARDEDEARAPQKWSAVPPEPGYEYPPEVVLRFGGERRRRRKRGDGGDGAEEGGDDDGDDVEEEDDDDGDDGDDGRGGGGGKRNPVERVDLLSDELDPSATAVPRKTWSWWSYLWPYYYFV